MPCYLKIWLFFSLVNLCELRSFLRKTDGKVELVTLTANDYSLLDSQRETYLKELKREEENNSKSEFKELGKFSVNDYSLLDSQRKTYLEELKREEEKNYASEPKELVKLTVNDYSLLDSQRKKIPRRTEKRGRKVQ